jgi:quinol monooxygenase YgiN
MKYITVVRGTLKAASQKESQAAHDAAVEKLSAMTRPMGAIGHQPYLNPQNPKEFLAVDTWNNLEALQKFMADPNVAAEFGKLFDGMPDVTIWQESGWASFMD